MENYLKKNFGYVKVKNSSEEELRRWRKACWLVKNGKRRFRYTANLSKRSEANAIRHAFKKERENSPVRPFNEEDCSAGDDEEEVYEVHKDSPVRASNKKDSSDGDDEKKQHKNFSVHPSNKEDSSDGDDEKVSKERTSPRKDDLDSFFSISDEDEESVGNTLSDNISERVHHVSPNGSSRLRITSWQKGKVLGRGSYGTVYEGIGNMTGVMKTGLQEGPGGDEDSPVRPLNKEDWSDEDDEKVSERSTSQGMEDWHSCLSTSLRDEECDDKDDVGNTLPASGSKDAVGNTLYASGSFKQRITSWDKGEFLGRGSFGSVYEGICNDGFFVAIKEVSLLDQGSRGKQSLLQLEQEFFFF